MPEVITISQSDFSDGQDNATSLTAGDPPIEIGVAEVGADGVLADYSGIEAGVNPDTRREARDNEVFIDLLQSDGTQVPNDTTQVRFIVRRRSDSDGPNMTPYINSRNQNVSDPRQRKSLPEQGQIASDGRLVAWQVRDQTNGGYNVSRSHSVLVLPALGYDKSEVR